MVALEQVGHDDVLGRDLFLLAVAGSEDLPPQLWFTTSRFVCLIAWDARAATVNQISTVARRLLNSGAVYICTWGPDCERVHDVIDEEHVSLTGDAAVDSVVMTTWHDNESLAQALRFVLTATSPDEAYEEDCGATVGIAIGVPEWAAEIRAAFSRPRDFVRQLDAEL